MTAFAIVGILVLCWALLTPTMVWARLTQKKRDENTQRKAAWKAMKKL